jgi:hypothetical protein
MPLRVIGTVFLLIGLVLVGVRVFRPQIEQGVAGALASGRLGEGGAAVAHAIRMGQDLAAVQAASTEVEARAAVARAEESMRRLDIPPEAIRERFTGMAGEAPADRPWIAEALLDAAERLPAAEDAAPLVRPLTPPELATAYADAAAAGDSMPRIRSAPGWRSPLVPTRCVPSRPGSRGSAPRSTPCARSASPRREGASSPTCAVCWTTWGSASAGRPCTSPSFWRCGAGRHRANGCWASAWCG